MDFDADLDVAACAFLPGTQHPQFQNIARQGQDAAAEVGLSGRSPCC